MATEFLKKPKRIREQVRKMFLSSSASDYLTVQSIYVDGGFIAK